ncbi:MAG: hypothetical protein IPK13_25935 [Deltaproteobacteria bacterium]|nr:hypothetical protein [Deltaproteobacteria bacterium]
MTSEEQDFEPRRSFRIGRFFVLLLIITLTAAGLYGASWINSRRFFLIVETGDVSVAQGRMFPVGHEPFVPSDPTLSPAYASFPLPAGMMLPRGVTTFSDRVELDQALYRILRDSAEYVLSHDADLQSSAELSNRYLQQIAALPGTNMVQQAELAKLRLDAEFMLARGRVRDAQRLLEDASQMFSILPADAASNERIRWAQAVTSALDALQVVTGSSVRSGPARAPVAGDRIERPRTRRTQSATATAADDATRTRPNRREVRSPRSVNF